jgi:DNA-binding Lrp family transcriptional regulator
VRNGPGKQRDSLEEAAERPGKSCETCWNRVEDLGIAVYVVDVKTELGSHDLEIVEVKMDGPDA